MAGEYTQRLVSRLETFDFPAEIESVYFGGGTPSLLDVEYLKRIFDTVSALPLTEDAEISMEANPETLTWEKLSLIRSTVNRLSIGVQSFDENVRRTLGRDCSDSAIKNALDMAENLEFSHLNCDLMYAVPGQSMSMWESDLRRAAESGVDHVSCYSLTPEEGTLLVRNGLTAIDEELSADMWELAGKVLAEYSFHRYEVSNYARQGGECRHNMAVWRGSLLYGFGPAAASYDGKKRYTQCADVRKWLGGAQPEEDWLTSEKRRREIAVVNLRTVSGWTKEEYLQLPGATETEWYDLIEEANKLNMPELIVAGDERLFLAEKGLLFWDAAASELL